MPPLAQPFSPPLAPPPAPPHTVYEDAYGLFAGVVFVVLGTTLLKAAGLLTGGVAGIALLASYEIAWPVGVLFMLINIPFFLFGYLFMGLRFTVKSLIGSAMIMALLQLMPQALNLSYALPVVAAVAGGTLNGMGILAFARHGAGVGGTGIVTLWLQKKYAVNAGRTQIVIDCAIMLAGLLFLSPQRVGWSALSAIAMSAMVIAWHRPGRYSAG
jgi:uncharacterized membrane-anchored protein YitT (DUF2179 family)